MSLLLLNLVYVTQADFQQLVSFTFNFSRLLFSSVPPSAFTDGVRIKRGSSSATPTRVQVTNHVYGMDAITRLQQITWKYRWYRMIADLDER